MELGTAERVKKVGCLFHLQVLTEREFCKLTITDRNIRYHSLAAGHGRWEWVLI
jgi:hypothetical protein